MHLLELQHRAVSVGVDIDTLFKRSDCLSEKGLIRAIQVAEGGAPCFKKEGCQLCTHTNCEWFPVCTKLVAYWRR